MNLLRLLTAGLLATTFLFFSACERHDPLTPGNLVPKTVDEDPSLPAIEINGTRLHARSFGNAGDPLLLFLHGGPGGDHRMFLPYQDLARQGFQVVMFDQRGAGLSRRHDPEVFTLENYEEDLTQVIDFYTQSDTQPVVLIGHSWGAMYVTLYVNEFPDRIDGMVLMEPGGLTDEQMQSYGSRAQPMELTAEWLNDLLFAERLISPKDHNLYDYQMIMALGSSVPTENGEIKSPTPVWRFGSVANAATIQNSPDFDWTTHLEAYLPKVMFLYGDSSPGYTQEHMQEITSAYRNIEVIQVQNSGHDIPFEAETQLRSLLDRYLTEIL
jgi:proline iminopeptidase